MESSREIKKKISNLNSRLKKAEKREAISKLPSNIQKCKICIEESLNPDILNEKRKLKCPNCKQEVIMIGNYTIHCPECHWDSKKETNEILHNDNDDDGTIKIDKNATCKHCNVKVKSIYYHHYYQWRGNNYHRVRATCPKCKQVGWYTMWYNYEPEEYDQDLYMQNR